MSYPPVPDPPVLAEPEGCCDAPCTDCFVAQNQLQVSGLTGTCASTNGTYNFLRLDTGDGYCRWVYGPSGFFELSVTYYPGTGVWFMRLNGGSGDMEISGSIVCSGSGALVGSGTFETQAATSCAPAGDVGTVTLIP